MELQLERADAEARLARRKKAAGPATDPVRKEIDRIEDMLTGLMAQEKFIDERLEQMAGEIRKANDRELERGTAQGRHRLDRGRLSKARCRGGGAEHRARSSSRIRHIEDALAPTTWFAVCERRSWPDGGRMTHCSLPKREIRDVGNASSGTLVRARSPD